MHVCIEITHFFKIVFRVCEQILSLEDIISDMHYGEIVIKIRFIENVYLVFEYLYT